MHILIGYATKSGASRMSAETLASHLDHPELVNLSKERPVLEKYDVVILGSGIRMGKAYKPFIRFLRENQASLQKKALAVYFCQLSPDEFDQIVQRNLPAELQSRAIWIKSFGGIPPFTRPKTMDWMQETTIEECAARIKAFPS